MYIGINIPKGCRMSIKKQNCLKMGRKVALLATVCALFVACSDEEDDFFVQRADDEESDESSSSKKSSTKSSSSEENDILVVTSFDDLFVCTDKREGMFAYVKDERKTYVCEDGDWVIDDGAPVSSSEDEETSSSSKVKSSSSESEDSSSSEGNSSSSEGNSSSSGSKSSSSEDNSSSSKEKSSSSESSSSSEVVPREVHLECAPENKTIDRGSSTAWKIALPESLSTSTILAGDFTWTFSEDVTPSTLTKHGDLSSGAVVYATSGVKTATLEWTLPGSISGTATCSPLQVNGIPIAGCKCTTTSEEVSVTDGEKSVSWTVSGCTSDGANIVAYEWSGEGITGEGTAATALLKHKGEMAQPTLLVTNDDNTVEQVACPTVNAIDMTIPDFVLMGYGATNALTFEETIYSVMIFDIAPEEDMDDDDDTRTFICTANRGFSGDGNIRVKLGKYEMEGSDFAQTHVPATAVYGRKSLPFMVDVGNNVSVSCFLDK